MAQALFSWAWRRETPRENQKKLLFTSGMAGQLQCLQVGSEGPEEEEAPVQTPVAVSSSSSASSSASLEEDLENDPEMSLPQRLMADSTANTDPVLFEKSPRRQGGLCQPEWRNLMHCPLCWDWK